MLYLLDFIVRFFPILTVTALKFYTNLTFHFINMSEIHDPFNSRGVI